MTDFKQYISPYREQGLNKEFIFYSKADFSIFVLPTISIVDGLDGFQSWWPTDSVQHAFLWNSYVNYH